MQILTTEQALALAPDAASVKAGQGLANPGKWVSLGRSNRSVWGECQGSGKLPYRTQMDAQGPAFHCSCPSRKFPCKHGLGLLLLLAANPAHVPAAAPPPWVEEWLAKRDASGEKKAAKAAGEAPVDPETAAKREAEREKRAAKREDRVRAGLAELQTWLADVTRQGLAHTRQQSAPFFDAMAARMVDAQAPGVARRLRAWPGLFASGEGWAGHALEAAGSLQWLLHGFAHFETLPDGMRASVRQAIGFTVAEQELEGVEAVRDRWQVVGQIVEEEEKLRVQRTWLFGESTRRAALCLSFAAQNQALDVTLPAGTVLEADVAFHPSASPLRAIVRTRHAEPRPLSEPAGDADFAAALERASTLLAGDPWLDQIPWFVRDCLPFCEQERWHLRDSKGAVAPLARSFPHAWPLYAISGDGPVCVFGEWDGRALRPLSAFAGGRFISLGGPLF